MELDDDYYIFKGKHKKACFLIITIFVPIISIILAAIVVRGFSRRIYAKIMKTTNHPNLAGVVLTGLFVTFHIVGCDAAAFFIAVSKNHELNTIHRP